MNANVLYGVCNGDGGVGVGYGSASNYATDLAGSVYGGVYGSGSVSSNSGGGSSGQASTPESSGPTGGSVLGSVGPPHYLSHQQQQTPDPRTPPLTPHDQHTNSGLLQSGDVGGGSGNGLSYTNLDANGYATAAAAAAAAAAATAAVASYHLSPHSVGTGMGQHSISSVSVGNSSAYQTDYSGQHHGSPNQQQQHHQQLHQQQQQQHHHAQHQHGIQQQQQQQQQHHHHQQQQHHQVHHQSHHGHPHHHHPVHHGHHQVHPAMTGHGVVVDGTVGINGLSAAAVAIPTGATAGYGYPDVTQYGARVTHPAAAAGHFGSSVGPYGVGGPSLRDQCQVNGMLNLVGLGAAAAAAAQHPGQHHNQLQGQSGGSGGGGGNGGGVQPNLNHPVQQQQQSNVPTYKWMQVKRNVPKPGTFFHSTITSIDSRPSD